MKQPPDPMTGEQIRAVTVWDPEVHGGPIELVDYDPRWPELFAREAGRITAALGERAITVEHVGSTAVAQTRRVAFPGHPPVDAPPPSRWLRRPTRNSPDADAAPQLRDQREP